MSTSLGCFFRVYITSWLLHLYEQLLREVGKIASQFGTSWLENERCVNNVNPSVMWLVLFDLLFLRVFTSFAFKMDPRALSAPSLQSAHVRC